jgi:hypothetical protein
MDTNTQQTRYLGNGPQQYDTTVQDGRCFVFVLPRSCIRKANRKQASAVIGKSSRQNSRGLEEAVQDGECTVSRCGCGTGTVREPREGNFGRWKPVFENWCGTADREDQVHVSACYREL